jgi:hypothetical protein
VRGALVESGSALAPAVDPWRDHARGFILGAAERVTRNVWRKVTSLTADALLTPPVDFFTLDYRTLDSPTCHGSVTTVASKAGTAHGLAAWFDATIADGIGFSNEPGIGRAIYGQAFFPLANAVPVDAGDRVTLGLRATLLDDDYVWSWDVTVASAQGESKHRSSQSTFYAQTLSAESLRRADPAAQLRLNDAGKADLLVLERIDQGRTPAAIPGELARVFPNQFRTVDSALGYLIALITGRCEP